MHYIEAQELATAMMGMDEESDSNAVEQALFDRYDISFENFQRIAEDLIPFTIPAKTGLKGDLFSGFVKDGAFICKKMAEKLW